MNKSSAIVGFLLCFLAGMGMMYGIDRGAGHHDSDASASKDGATGVKDVAFDHSAAAVPATSKDPSWGSPNALVTIVEYSDFQ